MSGHLKSESWVGCTVRILQIHLEHAVCGGLLISYWVEYRMIHLDVPSTNGAGSYQDSFCNRFVHLMDIDCAQVRHNSQYCCGVRLGGIF